VINLYRAAFGDRPDMVITSVPADPRGRWLAAVTLGGQGRYAAAATLLRPVITGPDPILGALAAATFAAHRRQLGGHAAARQLDRLAYGRLAGHGAPCAWSDVLLGLAADALGLGRIAEARRFAQRARELGDAGWRGAIRLGWVSAEVELGAGRPEVAVPHAEEAAERAAGAGSTRHQVKSGLVLGAALTVRGRDADRVRARQLLDTVRGRASRLGLLSLLWPCRLLLAELEPANTHTHHRAAAYAMHGVLCRADPDGRRIARVSPWVPDLAGLTG
jgi:hypothetical protein